jgi:hypothetical protein
MKRIIIMALGVLLALALAAPMALAQVEQGAKASATTQVGTPSDKLAAAAWAQWAYSKPVDNPVDSPLVGGDPNYSEEQCDGTPVEGTLSPAHSKLWFLAGTFDASTVVRTCTMPAGTPLFFPLYSSLWVPIVDGENAANQRQGAIDSVNATLADPGFRQSMLVTVDGKQVNSDQIVRALSPVFTITLPEENVYDPFVEGGVPAGKYEGASVDGLWVKLPPLPPGEHTIHFTFVKSSGFSQNNTYNLTVVN